MGCCKQVLISWINCTSVESRSLYKLFVWSIVQIETVEVEYSYLVWQGNREVFDCQYSNGWHFLRRFNYRLTFYVVLFHIHWFFFALIKATNNINSSKYGVRLRIPKIFLSYDVSSAPSVSTAVVCHIEQTIAR